MTLRKVNLDGSESRLESDEYQTVWGSTPQLSAIFLLEFVLECLEIFVNYALVQQRLSESGLA